MTLLDSRDGNLREFSRRVEEANQILLGSDYDKKVEKVENMKSIKQQDLVEEIE
jgi:hypothetical protein